MTESNITLNEAIRIAKSEVKDPYAQAYLKAIPESIEEYGSHGFKVQLLYVLNNLKSWRGENARSCKKVLRKYAGLKP